MGEAKQANEPRPEKKRLKLYFKNSDYILENPRRVGEFRSVLGVWDNYAPQTDEDMRKILENCPIITGAYNTETHDLAVTLRPLVLDITRPEEIPLLYKNIMKLTGDLTWSTHRNDIGKEGGSVIMVDLTTKKEYERMSGGKYTVLHVLENYQGFRKFTISPSNARSFHEYCGATFTGIEIKNFRPGYKIPDVDIMQYPKVYEPDFFQPDGSF